MALDSCVLTLYVGHVCSLRSSLDAVEFGQALAERLGGSSRGWGAGWTFRHDIPVIRGAAGPGDAEGAAGPGLQREETIGAREESKSEGSNIVNNNSSGSRSGANKDDSKSEGNSNNNCSGCANSSRCEGKGGPRGGGGSTRSMAGS